MEEKQPTQVRVLIVEPNQPPYETFIDNDYKAMQQVVGGRIECIGFPNIEGVDIVVNEEGLFSRLAGNFWLPEYQDCVKGTCFISAFDEEGENINLTDEQIKKATKYITNFQVPEGLDLYSDFKLLETLMARKYKKMQESEEM